MLDPEKMRRALIKIHELGKDPFFCGEIFFREIDEIVRDALEKPDGAFEDTDLPSFTVLRRARRVR
jgi:hypothetical protein